MSYTYPETHLSEQRARFWHSPRWDGPGGMRSLLVVAAPMILSSAVHAFNLFLDRLFLSHYDQAHFAAAGAAGPLWWTSIAILIGLVGYVGTFVAQYTGANEPQRVGPSMWQAIYLSIVGGLLAMPLAFAAPWFFNFVGHEGNLPALETQYYQVLALTTVVVLVQSSLSAFYTGRGKTMFVLGVSVFSLFVNAGLNWWFIFHGGPGGIVPKGIVGAAWATVLATVISSLVYVAAIFNRRNESEFATRSGWRFDGELTYRMIRFGLPSGLHMLVDMIAFTSFMLVIGRFGATGQFASSVAMSLNMVVFIPAMGLHMAVSTLVGQRIGAREPGHAQQLTSGAMLLAAIYFTITGALYILLPEPMVRLFYSSADESTIPMETVLPLVSTLLIFVAAYSLFDAICLVLAGALKGAGDTKFVMILSFVISQVTLTIPCILIGMFSSRIEAKYGVLLCWTALTAYIMTISVVYGLRYRNGAWMRMRVIEEDAGKPAAEESPAMRLAPADDEAVRGEKSVKAPEGLLSL